MSETMFRDPELLPGYARKLGIERLTLDVKYVGAETVEGIAVDHLQIGQLAIPRSHVEALDQAVANLDLYLDQKTHLVIAFLKNILRPRITRTTYLSRHGFRAINRSPACKCPHLSNTS